MEEYQEYLVNPSCGNGIRPATSNAIRRKSVHLKRNPALTPAKSRRHHRREMISRKLNLDRMAVQNNYMTPIGVSPKASHTNLLSKRQSV